MADRQALLDQWGRPIERRSLTQEIAAPTIGGVRSPITGYPGDGLNPARLATILREADQGDPLRYLELAETIEERDLHYVGVLGTRRRSVAQIEISVEAASDDARDVAMADMVRDWLTRDELSDELFDILDAVGKGYSFTEIIWDTSEGQWQPQRLEWRDPRWFRPAKRDLTTPMLIDERGSEVALPGGKFISAVIKAKSGLPVRSGIARMATWAWMFKAFTQRDWAIFTQTYGQPLRIGRYGPGATEDDRATLFRAVANIAGDCAAIVPDGMSIEFQEAANLGTGHANYMERSDWLDRQVSKGVLGQTTTTDAISGGHAVSQEHRKVQEDIERADAKALSGVINRDLVRVWIDLEHGPQKRYPRIKIARPDEEDLDQLSNSLARLVPLGLRVQASEVRDKFGLAEPEDGAEVLGAPAEAEPSRPGPAADDPQDEEEPGPASRRGGDRAALQQEAPGCLPEELIAEAALPMAGPAIAALVGRVRGLIARAGSLEAAEAALSGAAGRLAAPAELVAAMRQALLLAWLSGEAAEAHRGEGDGDAALQARRGYDPQQPRVPAGRREGGRWTAGEDGDAAGGQALSPAERRAIADYAAADHLVINHFLRHGRLLPEADPDELARQVAALDAAIGRHVLVAETVLWRGVDPAGAARLAAAGLELGDVLEDSGFLSTSRNKNVANWFGRYGAGLVMRIRAPAGAPALDVAALDAGPLSEDEVLFARGRRLRVLAWNERSKIIDMEMLR